MRHRVKGKKLKRTASHRKSLYLNLATALFQYGAVETTLAKAKALRPFSERLITKARRQGLTARRELMTSLRTKEAFINLWEKIGPSYANRPGGYTRIVKLGFRRGDRAPMARIELVKRLPKETPARKRTRKAEAEATPSKAKPTVKRRIQEKVSTPQSEPKMSKRAQKKGARGDR